MRTLKSMTAVIVCALAARAQGTVIADSVGDFSGVQGQGSWYYGYWDRTHDSDGIYSPNEFQQMTQFLTTPSHDYGPSLHVPCWRVQDGAYWTALWQQGGHPNGTEGNGGHLPYEQWSIRRWTSTVSGLIDVSGQLGCSDGFGCNIIGRVIVDGTPAFTQIVPTGQLPQTYSLTVQVSIGSQVDFAIDPNGVDYNDMTFFTASISPEPGSALLVLFGMFGVASIRQTGANCAVGYRVKSPG